MISEEIFEFQAVITFLKWVNLGLFIFLLIYEMLGFSLLRMNPKLKWSDPELLETSIADTANGVPNVAPDGLASYR
jgi:hypothetical protein